MIIHVIIYLPDSTESESESIISVVLGSAVSTLSWSSTFSITSCPPLCGSCGGLGKLNVSWSTVAEWSVKVKLYYYTFIYMYSLKSPFEIKALNFPYGLKFFKMLKKCSWNTYTWMEILLNKSWNTLNYMCGSDHFSKIQPHIYFLFALQCHTDKVHTLWLCCGDVQGQMKIMQWVPTNYLACYLHNYLHYCTYKH